MAIVSRFFSPSGSGNADGTTVANAAPLFPNDVVNPILTSFAYAADALECRILPGSYTYSGRFDASIFTNNPSVTSPLRLQGSQAIGEPIQAPPGWCSAEPAAWTASLPTITFSSSTFSFALANTLLRSIGIVFNSRNQYAIQTAGQIDWCRLENSASGSSVGVANVASMEIFNSTLVCTGSQYASVLQLGGNTNFSNLRIVGNPSASSGSGITCANATQMKTLTRCVVLNNPDIGVNGQSTQTTHGLILSQCIIANNGGSGLRGNSIAGQSNPHSIRNSIIVNNGGFGIDGQSANLRMSGSRLRNNSNGNFTSTGNSKLDLNMFLAVGTDADEFVDIASGDYRIKNTSTLWGLNIGAGDAPASGGGGATSQLWYERPTWAR